MSVTASVLVIILLISLNLKSCVSQELSLRLIIEKRADLSKLASDQIIKNTDVFSYLGNTAITNTIFFAPSNTAFDVLPAKLYQQLMSSSKVVINRVFQYHLVPGVNSSTPFNPLSLSEGQQVRSQTLYSGTYIYASKLNDVTFINGAKITIPNLTATNGVINIIDGLLITNGPQPLGLWGYNGYDYVTNVQWDMSSIFKIFEDYQLRGSILQSGSYAQLTETILRNPNAFCTAFIPSNEFLQLFKLRNQDLYARISGQSPSLLKQVIESLIIPNRAYHMSLLEMMTTNGRVVDAVIGQIRVYTMDGIRYVSNRCGQARVLQEDLTTSNCVIHVIDNFLGLVTNDIFNETSKQTDLQEFTRSLLLSSTTPLVNNLRAKGGPEYIVPENEKFTVFAPTNEIFRYVDFSRNSDERLVQLSMVISPQLVDLSYLVDGGKMVVNTMREGYKATITRVKQKYYVEVNHIKAFVTQSNLCTSNGLIHKVDRVVGLPDGKISDYLSRRVNLRRLEVLIQETGLLTLCMNPAVKVTLFAPNESAVINMDPMFQGQQNKNKLIRLMYSHVSDGVLYLDSISDGSSVEVITYNGVVKVQRSAEEYWVTMGDARVKIIEGDIGASNGVVHIIERFMPYVYGDSMVLHTAAYWSTLITCFVFGLFYGCELW